LTATVTSGATGKVTFYDGVTILGIGTISGGQASITTVMLPSGNRSLRAYYQGNGTFAGSSSAQLPQEVIAGVSLGLRHPINFPAPFQSSGMAVADFNGDHKRDLALVDSYGNAVDIYLGNGDGTFQSAVAYPAGTTPGSIVVADFNGDGFADLAVITSGNSVDIFLGNGDGTFQPALNSVLSSILFAVAAGDFNGDGKADLVFADASNNLEVVLGNGDGTFGDTILVSAGGSTQSIAVADFNGDGKADLVVTYGYGGNVGVLLGNGDGTFQNPITQNIARSLTSVIVADFNGDGKTDIVAYAPSSNTQGGLGITVLLGNGDGTFETAGYYFTGLFLGSVAVEDFNGDGIPDIAVTGNLIGDGSVAIMPGNGDGTFGNTAFYYAPFDLGPSIAGDFNGDGIPDLVTAGSNTACVLPGGALPDLTIAVSRGTGFTQGQQGGAYTITVTDVGEHSSTGQVKMAATISAGLTPTGIGGAGWSCSLGTLTCTRTDSVGAQASYPAIVITVNVENGSEASLVSTFTVSGGGESNLTNDTATDTAFARYPTVTTFTAAPNPSSLSQPVSLTATVTAGATGNVNFYEGATLLGSASLAGGQSTFTTYSLPSGASSLHAAYLGDSNYGPSISPSQTQTVKTAAENGFVPYTSYAIPTGAFWIGAADLNGDGVTDLVTANQYSAIVLMGNGDGTFRTPVNYSLGNNSGNYPAHSGLIADFNNDGHPDVVAATGSGIFMLLGIGDGTFQPANLFTSAVSCSSLVAADFNRDGNLDLACLGPGGILLYVGNGDGTFQPPITLPSTSNAYNFVTAADLNRDGKPDLVALNSNLQTVGVFLGNGDGTFQFTTVSFGMFGAMALVVGDFDGDGVPDIALSGYGTMVLLGKGDGTFRSGVQTAQNGRAYADWYSLVAGDFNGDGKLDLAFGGGGLTGDSGLTLLFGNGDGSFQQGPFLPTSSSTAIAVGDFNRDGKLDIAANDNDPGTIDVYLGGQFSGLPVSSTHSWGFTIGQSGTYRIAVDNYAFATTSSTVSVRDTLPPGLTATAIGGSGWTCILSALTCTRSDPLTIDGAYPVITLTVNVAATLLPSVIDNQVTVTYAGVTSSAVDPTKIASPTTTTLTVSPNPATLGQPVTLTATVTSGATGSVLFLDSVVALGSAQVSNGQAILTTRLLPSGLQYLIATYSGDGTYAPSTSAEVYQTVNAAPANAFAAAASYLAGTTPWAIAAGDFNHDGRTDLVITNSVSNSVSVLPGNGDGTFGPHVDYPVGTYPGSVTVADFNGDGQADLAVATIANDHPAVSILLGNPDGSFQPAVNFTPPNGFYSLAASDFNGDGKVDLALLGGTVAILLGNGDGTFQNGGTYDLAGEEAIADFNLDGKVDIYSDAYGFIPGNGDGTFQSTTSLGYSFTARSIAAGDLNGDGKPDIVAADNFGNIVVLLGNGDGTFHSAQFPAPGVVAMSVLLADVNGDGKLDVVAPDNNSNGVSVLLGNGDGTLQSPIAYQVCSQAEAAVAGDFNGDGRTDIAITCTGSNNVAVLLGVLVPTLTISSSHSDPFAIGQAGATYTISVTNTGPIVTSGTVKVVDTLPSGLTATAIQGTGWNCTLATLTCTNTTSVPAGQSYLPIVVNIAVNNAGTGANQVSVSGGGAPSANASDPTTIVNPPIAIQTTPSGLQFTVDNGTAQTAPQTLNLTPGIHTLAVASTQSGTPGTQYVFSNWSDSGAASHTITVSAPATYTATFQTQYLLTIAPNPSTGGTVTPASGTYYNAGASVTLTATPKSPLTFIGWSGGATGTTNPVQISMNAPLTVTANFDIPGATCTMTGDSAASVADVQFIVNEALGIMPANNDLNNDGVVNIADIQTVLNAALNSSCFH
jgi:uncharacterized repeat protein (TIGR01451 family)